jgi:hypothetical protein
VRLHDSDRSVNAVREVKAVYFENAENENSTDEWIPATRLCLEDLLRLISVPVASIKIVSDYNELIF